MPSEASREWRNKYRIGARFENMIFIGPSDAVQFWKKRAKNGESAEATLKQAADEIAKKRGLTAVYKRGKKGQADTIVFQK